MGDTFARPDIIYLKLVGFGKRLWKIRNKESYPSLINLENGDYLTIERMGILQVNYVELGYKQNQISRTVVCNPIFLKFD